MVSVILLTTFDDLSIKCHQLGRSENGWSSSCAATYDHRRILITGTPLSAEAYNHLRGTARMRKANDAGLTCGVSPQTEQMRAEQLRLDFVATPSDASSSVAREREFPMGKSTDCQIVAVGKRRDGGTRYWCLEHKADATAKYGKRAGHCRYAHVPPIKPKEVLSLDLSGYPGGVALWGAVPPVYDTTRLPLDRGIHVHARRVAGGSKEVDGTYRQVRLIGGPLSQQKQSAVVSELDAIYYMVTSVFGYRMKHVECSYCAYPHLDKDWFSVHAHRSHLCAGCGKHFRDTDVAIGNPISRIRNLLGSGVPRAKPAKKKLDIRQADFPGGIQIWGSNPAIVWTGQQSEEEGIHIHAFTHDGSDALPDDTFSHVRIDGIDLDPLMVRTLMAQSALPHIANRVVSVDCPKCSEPHFGSGEQALTPNVVHHCTRCQRDFPSKGRLRKTIGNPLVAILDRLASYAPRLPQKHEIDLLPETL